MMQARNARSVRRSVVPILPLALGFALACTTPPDDPDGVRGRASDLSIGKPAHSQLECGKGDCADWYRVRLDENGLLTVKTTVAPGHPGAQYVIHLENGFGRSLDALDQTGSGNRELSRNVEAGFYMIGFVADDSDRFGYSVELAFEPERRRKPRTSRRRAPRPAATKKVSAPAPKPRFDSVEAEVLEVEGKLAEPQGILLDLGRLAGVDEAVLGELRDGDQVIGQIEIVDVYPEGSRARIVGRLRRALTPSIRAFLRIPLRSAGGGRESDATPTGTD